MRTNHSKKCGCIECKIRRIYTPGTRAYKRFQKELQKWNKRTVPLRKAYERSEQLTAEDFTLRVGTSQFH
jgi:hypothetical protein